MKSIQHIVVIALATMVMASCGSAKQAADSRIEKGKSIEGADVVVETMRTHGIEMADELSEDGTKIIKVAYKWYAGIGKANDKQTAIEMAEREARATISRVVENLVLDQAERGTLGNNGDVQKAITSHWQQVSRSIQNACEPFGDTKIEYNPATHMYTVTSKVGIRGDKYQQMLNNAGNFKPSNLSGDELKEFVETNKAIMNAAKGE